MTRRQLFRTAGLGAGVGLWESAEVRVNPSGSVAVNYGADQAFDYPFPSVVKRVMDSYKSSRETVERQPGGFRYGSPAKDAMSINNYWYRDHFSNKVIRKFLDEIFRAMNDGNHNNSRAEIDYFDVGWYIDVNIGKWNKPYTVEK